MRTTPLSRLLDHQLGGNLCDHVVQARAAGSSWRDIAKHLSDQTGTEVSFESLRSWFSDESDLPIGRAS